MTDYPLQQAVSGVVANGKAVLSIGPQLAREQWNVATTTVTSLSATITVATDGQVIDSTANDPRPTVTDNTPFQLMAGHTITVTWTNLSNGTQVQVTVKGTRRIGGSADSSSAPQRTATF